MAHMRPLSRSGCCADCGRSGLSLMGMERRVGTSVTWLLPCRSICLVRHRRNQTQTIRSVTWLSVIGQIWSDHLKRFGICWQKALPREMIERSPLETFALEMSVIRWLKSERPSACLAISPCIGSRMAYGRQWMGITPNGESSFLRQHTSTASWMLN
jgi:hypothetical protein